MNYEVDSDFYKYFDVFHSLIYLLDLAPIIGMILFKFPYIIALHFGQLSNY